jgi:hypothetical protein
MQGYEVVTSDGERLGEVSGTLGRALVVERGTLRKSRHALPLAFAHADDDARVVRTTISRDLFEASPRVGEDTAEQEIADYYGLVGEDPAPTTLGRGVVDPDDPATGAEQDELRAGIEPAAQERARIREGIEGGEPYGGPGRPIHPPDPHVTGGP